jgi:hypothetical protein
MLLFLHLGDGACDGTEPVPSPSLPRASVAPAQAMLRGVIGLPIGVRSSMASIVAIIELNRSLE